MTNMRVLFRHGLLLAALGFLPARNVQAQSLSADIDRIITAQAGGELAEPAGDAEFFRRVTLDLTGTLPASDDVRTFLADAAADKRLKAIDRLLGSPEYPRRMAELASVILLERRDGQLVPEAGWQAYLQEAFAAGKPWNELVRELLSADGSNEKTRPGLRLMADGGRSDGHVRTQDFARIFLGRNIQCAQCHDHPTISDYLQHDYFGLFAMLSPTGVHQNQEKQSILIETLVKEKVPFQSVFKPDDKRSTGPKLPGVTEVEIPPFVAGEEFAVAPQNGLPGRPKFQPRMLLAEQLTAPGYRPFARTTVNRFWFELMGRGLVHPLDLDHRDNPPSHPELLDRLTDEFVSHRFDVRWLLREILLSAAYQRGSILPAGVTAAEIPVTSYRVALSRPLSAEQLMHGTAAALGQRARLDAAVPAADVKFTYKDYVNGRLPPPENWRDALVVFRGTFGHPAGQAEVDFRPSVEQALFFENDRLIAAWLQPAPGSLLARLQGLEAPATIVDELYLTLFTRLPTDVEREEIVTLLGAGADRLAILQDVCAGMLSSAEFRLNH